MFDSMTGRQLRVARQFSRAVAGAVILAVLAPMSGCSLIPSPPPEVSTAIDSAAGAIRATAGVAAVTSDIYPRDFKDGGPLTEPDAWTATITVAAEKSGVDVRALAESVGQSAGVGIVSTTVLLRIPGENGDADAQLNFTPLPTGSNVITEPDEMADAVLTLRELAGARSVSVFDHGDPAAMLVESATVWEGLARTLRDLPGFGLDALSAVTMYTEENGNTRGAARLIIDAASPAPALVQFLGEVATNGAVQSMSFTGIDTRRDPSAQRPELRVEVSTASEVDTITGMLTAFDDARTRVEGVPRAAFHVSTRTGDIALTTTGYLGLPLESAEPDDRIAGTPEAAPLVSLDPAAAATRLERDRVSVSALLDAAGDAAGIRGPATVTIGPCDNGADQRVQGSVIIPIFEIADSADEAFAAITTAWEVQGLTKSDRAMGTDFYSAADDGLETLSIRGGTEGISISATAACVVSP